MARRTVGKPGSARLFLRGNGKPWGKSEQRRPLDAACDAARIDPPVSFHGFRHTYASRLAMRGAPLAVIAAQLGHTDTRMVEKHYGHLAPSYVADTMRAEFGELGILRALKRGADWGNNGNLIIAADRLIPASGLLHRVPLRPSLCRERRPEARI